jgi:hypothetical protein
MGRARMNIEVSEDLANLIAEVATREGVTKAEVIRRGLSVVKAYSQQIKVGRTHLGFASRADQLDVELLGVLSEEAWSRP